MKSFIYRMICVIALLVFLPLLGALGDDAGVMTETELGGFVSEILLRTKGIEPQNAPIGEESLTEEGYAFIYPFATLYYNQPTLDATSILQGFAITDETLQTPRNIRLGSPMGALVEAYGWQNPDLYGDGSFAAFYQLRQLPECAYWSWARMDENGIASVQCAIHASVGSSGMYTDAGIVYQVQDNLVTSIRIYGLKQVITLSDVESNLRAVIAVQAAGSGDEEPEGHITPAVVEGYFQKSEAEEFGRRDLQFAQIDFLSLGETEATRLFGEPIAEDWVQDDTGEWLHIVQRQALTLTYMLDEGRENARLESLSLLEGDVEGPRGIRIGDSLGTVLSRFRSDGTGETFEGQALLYGDGQSAPCGALAISGDSAALRYVAQMEETDGMAWEITLHLSFVDGQLMEILLHSW